MAFVAAPPTPQTLQMKIKGLYTNPNQLSEAPDGALATADNIWINKDSIAESRRGFVFLPYALPHAADRADKMGQFDNRLLVHYNNTVTTNNNDSLGYYDNSTGFNTYTGVYAHPDPLLARMKFAESNQNIYFTTANGVYKNDLITNTPVIAGMYQGLDVNATASASGSGFQNNNSEVAYRVVWGITDANNNLNLGAPSQRAVISNVTGTVQNVSLQITIPTGITTNHFFQVYRSDQSLGITAQSVLTLQDITYTANPTGYAGTAGNVITVAYTTGGTAGSEVVTVSGTGISIQIQSGVSTAAQVLAAFNNKATALVLASGSITGVYTNAQTAAASGTLSGGTITLSVPNDNMQLVYEANPTSGQITAKSVTLVDSTPDSLRGAALYTNATQQGILQSNNQPPYATDMALFQTCMFYSNTQTLQQLFLTVLAVGGSSGIATGDTMTIAGTTYTGSDATSTGSYQFAVTSANATTGATYTNNGVTFTVVGTIAAGTTLVTTGSAPPALSITCTSANATLGSIYTDIGGNRYTTTATIASQTTIVMTGINAPVGTVLTKISGTGDGTITFSAASGTLTKASGTGDSTITFQYDIVEIPSQKQYRVVTTGSPAQNINDTTLSLIRVINQSAANTSVYAYYLSGANSLPGQMMIQARTLGAAAFTVVASGHGSAFNPALPTSGSTVISTNTTNLNGLMYSKAGQPEAVPSLNILYPGSASKKILRIVPIRNSLFILKEDGVFRCTGVAGNFSIDTIDSTIILLAPESAVALSNQCFCLTTQGVVAISDNGGPIVSRPIEDQLVALEGLGLQQLQDYSFGCSYESERQYVLWTITTSADTYATQAFVYNYITKAWTRSTRQQTHALVLTSDNKQYLLNPASNQISQERKSYLYTDYSDEAYAITINSINGLVLTLASASNIVVGDAIYQSGAATSLVTAVNYAANQVTVLNLLTSWTVGAASNLKSIACLIEWLPNTAGNPGYLRHWAEVLLVLKQNIFNNALMNFYSEISSGIDSVLITGTASGGWGEFAWGSQPWGGVLRTKPFRTYVPLEKQRCDLLSIQFQIQNVWAQFQIEGVSCIFETIGPRVTT